MSCGPPGSGSGPGFRRRVLVALLAVSFLGVALAASLPLCPMAGLLGIPCPGCGLSRATLAALRGDFSEAYHYHPLVFVLVPVCGLALGSLVVSYLFEVRTPTGGPATRNWTGSEDGRLGMTTLDRVVSWVGAACLIAMLVVWIARFMGYFGGPAPVTPLLEWARGR